MSSNWRTMVERLHVTHLAGAVRDRRRTVTKMAGAGKSQASTSPPGPRLVENERFEENRSKGIDVMAQRAAPADFSMITASCHLGFRPASQSKVDDLNVACNVHLDDFCRRAGDLRSFRKVTARENMLYSRMAVLEGVEKSQRRNWIDDKEVGPNWLAYSSTRLTRRGSTKINQRSTWSKLSHNNLPIYSHWRFHTEGHSLSSLPSQGFCRDIILLFDKRDISTRANRKQRYMPTQSGDKPSSNQYMSRKFATILMRKSQPSGKQPGKSGNVDEYWSSPSAPPSQDVQRNVGTSANLDATTAINGDVYQAINASFAPVYLFPIEFNRTSRQIWGRSLWRSVIEENLIGAGIWGTLQPGGWHFGGCYFCFVTLDEMPAKELHTHCIMSVPKSTLLCKPVVVIVGCLFSVLDKKWWTNTQVQQMVMDDSWLMVKTGSFGIQSRV
ncbi:hypothetical protein EDD18DRAFT_1334497 [Armillaria luteobubalina]|uniref:Uncharacterized protein n=1 Tax=Armillaria luteobubalina TaxID=153913 RepID=A0AA39PYC4_9AGAR|nr:hypothetical protein EDD18DRAFT_1334497 [Armillaria luteobubalina]